VLGEPVEGPYSRIYCGGDADDEGTLAKCRDDVLEPTLDDAIATDRESLYDDDPICEEEAELEPQYCYDTVAHTAAGAITQPLIHWINRPTFQQVVEVQQSVPRDPGGEPPDPPDEPPGGGDPPDGPGDGGPGRNPDGNDNGGGPLGSGGGDVEQTVATIAAGAANDADGGGGGLPFTGFGLIARAVLGLLLLGAGIVTRRRAAG